MLVKLAPCELSWAFAIALISSVVVSWIRFLYNVSGLSCFGVHVNYCGSIPNRIYTNPVTSTVTHRCGLTEIFARTFCSAPCTNDEQCSGSGESCLGMNPNYCGSTYTEVGVTLETWSNIHVSSVADFVKETNDFLDAPNRTVILSSLLEMPSNAQHDHFGVRMRGNLVAPVTGDYIFWIASDDNGEFWLSTDSQRTNKARICYHTGRTTSRQWTKYSTQQSAPIALVAGTAYYYEVSL